MFFFQVILAGQRPLTTCSARRFRFSGLATEISCLFCRLSRRLPLWARADLHHTAFAWLRVWVEPSPGRAGLWSVASLKELMQLLIEPVWSLEARPSLFWEPRCIVSIPLSIASCNRRSPTQGC